MTDTGMMLAYSQAAADQLKAENERLRAALQDIADGVQGEYAAKARATAALKTSK